MAEDKRVRKQAELAERVAKHADLSVNVVLRVFYALKEQGYAVAPEPTSPDVPKPVVKIGIQKPVSSLESESENRKAPRADG